MTSGQHDNLWAIGTAIAVGFFGWGLVKAPARWYVAVTMPVMCVFWGVFLIWALGSANHLLAFHLRNAIGILFFFELGIGPIVATFFGVTGLVKKKDTARRTFIINQALTWTYAFVAFGFWGLLFYAAKRGA